MLISVLDYKIYFWTGIMIISNQCNSKVHIITIIFLKVKPTNSNEEKKRKKQYLPKEKAKLYQHKSKTLTWKILAILGICEQKHT